MPIYHSVPTQVDAFALMVLQIPRVKEIIEGFRETLKLVWGDHVPSWIPPAMGYAVLLGFLLVFLWGFLNVLSKIKDLLTEKFWPIFYDQEKRRRVEKRRRFADHIEGEIRRLNGLEAWSDYRFAELEADVDAEGRKRGSILSSLLDRSTIRREHSLSTAIENSKERLIILEGDPGSGKSVAQRHVAQRMALAAMKSRSQKAVIPIYVNLKELNRASDTPIDRNLIESFVLEFLNRVRDRDIEEFLEHEFSQGLKEGTWFFLFDSFDELPEVLSSTETDQHTKNYANAIADFLRGMNKCRGIIASRRFRGPKQFGWPRFVIRPLSEARREELIHKAGLRPEQESRLIGEVETAGEEIKMMARNPTFLGLLCNHIRDGNPFPNNVHSVYETYIATRLNRDADRIKRRFELEISPVRRAAENIAFCISADYSLGLSRTRESLRQSTIRLGLGLGEQFDQLLDAIEYIKLARSETATNVGNDQQFTFAHRRFQEYFATRIVLADPGRVSPLSLLTDARWRETAVVLCQTQQDEFLVPIVVHP